MPLPPVGQPATLAADPGHIEGVYAMVDSCLLLAATTLNLFEMLFKPPLLYYTILFIFLAAISVLIRTPEFKGWIGEVQVNILAWLLLDKRKYRLVKNVTLPSGDGTTQIDHIIVSKFGVFVVETKNMNGWIFGSEREATWTQKFRGSSRQFQNPLRQNYKHAATLSQLLELPAEKIKSVVVFIGDAKIKTQVPPNVTIAAGYVRYIKAQREEILTDEQVRQVLGEIATARLAPSLETHRQHVKHVKQIVAEKTTPRSPGQLISPSQPAADVEPPGPVTPQARTISSPAPGRSAVTAAGPDQGPAESSPPKCPTCGMAMVLRTAGRGPNAGKRFWGCSGFPKCREIVQCG
jgi:hypothetical protein